MLVPDGPVVFVLGGPGSGKGTQCAKLVERYGAAHFSAGDLLRAEAKKGTEQGKMIDEMIKQGALVPTQITLDLLKAAIKSRKGPYLIDGFPRSLDNLQAFDNQVYGGCALTLVYDLSEAAMEERLLKHGETSGRADDNAATIKKRFKTFWDESMPVIDILRARKGGLMVSTIDASRTPQEVAIDTWRVFDKIAKVINMLVPDGPVVFMLGAPGTGKGAQCAKLVERYGAAHIKVSDLLRAEVKKGTEQGKMIDEIMKEHDVVPAPITLDLLKAAIKTRKGPYIIDGFPRSLDNLHAFDDQVYGGHRGFGCALAIFYFMADAEIAVKRKLERNQTQKKLIQDLDEHAEELRKKFHKFKGQCIPVIEKLKNRGLLATVDGHPSFNAVFTATCKAFDKVAAPLVTWRKAQVTEYLAKHAMKERLEAALHAAVGSQAPDPASFVAECIAPPGPRRPRTACGTFLRIVTVNDVYKLDNYPRVASAVAAAKKAAAALDCVVISTLPGDER